MKTKHKLFNYIIPFVVDGLSIQERKFPKKIPYTIIEDDIIKPDHESLLRLFNLNFYQKETYLSYEEFNTKIKDIFVADLLSYFTLSMMYVYGNFTETLEESNVMETISMEIFLQSQEILSTIDAREDLIREWFFFQDVVGNYEEYEYGDNGNQSMYNNIIKEYEVFHKISGLIYTNNWLLPNKEYVLLKENEHLFEEVLFGEE